MSEIFDTFFVLDFDRCLGNFEANLEMKKKLVSELTIMRGEDFQKAHDDFKADGSSFRVLKYLKENIPNFDENAFMGKYIEEASKKPINMLEPGAVEFIDFIRSTGHYHCIMTFGDKKWQTTKVKGAGLGDIITFVVPTEYKGKCIAEWFDEESDCFIVPGECFNDGQPRRHRQIVLIDDKLKAFDGLHPKAHGYLLQSIARIYVSPQGKVPKNVRRVTRLDEIISYESIAKKTTSGII